MNTIYICRFHFYVTHAVLSASNHEEINFEADKIVYIIYFHKYINSCHIYAASSSLSPSSMSFMVSEDDEQDTDYGSWRQAKGIIFKVS